jgi:hypothetical protein
MEYHHYDQNGKYIGSSDDGQGMDPNTMGGLFGIGFFAVGCFWLWELLVDWKEYDAPLSYIAGYYYFIIIVPLKSVGDLWAWSASNPITSFSNLNTVLSVLLEAAYLFFIVYVIKQIVSKKGKLNFLSRIVLLAYLGPAIAFAALLLIGGALSWLFA